MRYMIVDDNAGMRSMIRQFVCTPADAVVECADGPMAVRHYPAFRPDFVLMDVEMAPMDGFETTKQIRSQDPAARVIFITGHDTSAFRTKAQMLNAAGFVPKENLPELISLVKNTDQC